MSDEQEPRIPCGIYRTTRPIEESIPAGVLVFFHNHGDPGPGVYLPREWKNNHATFHAEGVTIPDATYPESLEPLLPEGFYRVAEPFHCCEDRCQYFEEEMLVQLGYNGGAEPILFVPEVIQGALAIPTTGTIIDDWKLAKLRLLKVVTGQAPTHDGVN